MSPADSALNGENTPLRVLFLCTHNSARSQIAEALLRAMGGDNVASFSAGTEVTRVHADALALLQAKGIPTDSLSSKHLSQYMGDTFDIVITVCDNARDACPAFPGAGTQLHWSLPDPSAVADAQARKQRFATIYAELRQRISLLLRSNGIQPIDIPD